MPQPEARDGTVCPTLQISDALVPPTQNQFIHIALAASAC
jgi:hypothetical protein